ncbi:MAG: hypothetical protein ACU83N_04305 [Gammaproteobacteria bacterium]
MFKILVFSNRNAGKIFSLGLAMLAILTGCLADSVRMPVSARPELRTIHVVAVEPPPLEVMPDLLESRMPVYRHYDNMVLPFFPDIAVYRNPGGILIAGRVGQGDSVETVRFSEASNAVESVERLQTMASPSSNWLPTVELTKVAVSHLRMNRIDAIEGRQWLRLPMTVDERSAGLAGWRNAVEQWYDRGTSTVDYRKLAGKPVDAVLEIGIGYYKIVAGQLTLQVLIKLIDPGTGRVIARHSESNRSFEASAESVLAYEGLRFKELIRKLGGRSMRQAFQEIGLISKPMEAPMLPIPS